MLVALNMAMSLDGKIATKARGPVKLASRLDTRRMAEIRAESDVVINGAATFRAYPYPLHVVGEDLLAARTARGASPQPVSAVVSSRLDLPPRTPWEKHGNSARWVFCGRNASETTARRLAKAGVRVIRSRRLRPTPEEILAVFAESGFRQVLLEGGGAFNAAFLEKGLVQRLYLTLAPLLIGGRNPQPGLTGKASPRGNSRVFCFANAAGRAMNSTSPMSELESENALRGRLH